MKSLWKDILLAVWLGVLLPGIVLNWFVFLRRHENSGGRANLTQETLVMHPEIMVLQNTNGIQKELELDEYLTGVLLAEMPAFFHPEALKAQSVASRTYTWKSLTTGGKHGNGSLCMDANCCQAYMTEADYLAAGGLQESIDKIRQAVIATAPFVLTYNGELIEATYFSSSGGLTEAAVAVWGADYPYLQAVSSPETGREDQISFTLEEISDLLEITFPEDPNEWFGSITYTPGGGVDTMEICGKQFSGIQLRSALGLRSTVFALRTEDDHILISTKGYGHRVGMSQYGANTFAENGSTWQRILQHYYPGATLVPAY